MGDQDELLLLIALRRHARSGTPQLPPGGRLFLVLVLIAIVAVVGVALTTAAVVPHLVSSSCASVRLKPLGLGEDTRVYAADGSLLGVIPSVQHRRRLKLWQMSRWLPPATVAIEDRRFWQHGALDYHAIARAAWRNLASKRTMQGASTLTQQLARNLYIGKPKRTLHRKVVEACLAMRLERLLSKRTILADYLNAVYYGNHAFGVQAAAQTYFSRNASALNLPQAALLAGLPQAPSDYDPLARPQAALSRRNEVLAALRDQKKITPAQYRWASATPLGLRPGSLYSKTRNPYFFGFVQKQLVDRFGARAVASGGLRVRTTIDPRLQGLANGALDEVLRARHDPAGALVAIDPRNGWVRAMAVRVPSGRRLTFNLATQGHRQAGSAFKPFTLATAMSQGISLYSSFSGPPLMTIPDPTCEGPDGHWDVHNYADESAGSMNLIDAITHSVNTIFAQLVVAVGPQNVVATAHRMGIESPIKPVCSVTLGSQAVTPLEMADSYATLAARGVHHDPESLAVVRGPRGGVLPLSRPPARRALSPNAADLVTYALQGVIKRGTGTAADFGRPEAGKTGTAEDFVDGWFCGYVPQLATCVWIGYPHAEVPLLNVEGVPQVFGGSLPAEIWRSFMAPAVSRLPVMGFHEPSFDLNTAVPDGAWHG